MLLTEEGWLTAGTLAALAKRALLAMPVVVVVVMPTVDEDAAELEGIIGRGADSVIAPPRGAVSVIVPPPGR